MLRRFHPLITRRYYSDVPLGQFYVLINKQSDLYRSLTTRYQALTDQILIGPTDWRKIEEPIDSRSLLRIAITPDQEDRYFYIHANGRRGISLFENTMILLDRISQLNYNNQQIELLETHQTYTQ